MKILDTQNVDAPVVTYSDDRRAAPHHQRRNVCVYIVDDDVNDCNALFG